MGSFSISMSFPRHGYYAGRNEGRISLLDEGSSADEDVPLHAHQKRIGRGAPCVVQSHTCTTSGGVVQLFDKSWGGVDLPVTRPTAQSSRELRSQHEPNVA